MFEEIKPALVIARREVRDQFRDWRIVFPVLFLTVFFPFLMNFTAQQILDFVRGFGAEIIGERMVPFLFMIVGFFPISASLVIALETFVGEKERGSIEPLLNSPLKDWQLYLGKLLSSVVPPLAGSFLGMAVYLGGLLLARVAIPEVGLMFQIVLLTIIQAVMMVSGAVVVSSQATSVRAANLLASFIVIPVAMLVQVEAVVMFWGRDTNALWWILFGLAALSILLVRVGLAHFQREELLGREIDVLNFRWGWRVFRNAFRGDAKNPWNWFFRSVPRTLKSFWLPIVLVTVLAGVGVWVGWSLVEQFPIHFETGDLTSRLQTVGNIFPTFSARPVILIWWQNIRTQIIGLILGIFTFGILGTTPLWVTMGATGYLLGILSLNGISAGTIVVGFFLPHAIFEIPALIISCAGVLRLGALLATPNSEKTVGEVFLAGLGEWTRIFVGVVIPLLLIASVVETWITPQVASYLLLGH